MKKTTLPFWRGQNLLGPLGGFVAILGYVLPFNVNRSLFVILDQHAYPFLAEGLLLTVVAIIILYSFGFDYVPHILSIELLLVLCLLYGTFFYLFPVSALLENLQIGAYVIPLGLLAMVLHSMFCPRAGRQNMGDYS